MDTTAEQGDALIDAVEALLRPLLPLFRNYGVTHHELSQMLARLFVYDTAEVLEKEGRPTTVARLAITAGLPRGLVEKHLADRKAATVRRRLHDKSVTTPGEVLTVWNTDSRFCTIYGVALDLPLRESPRQRSFIDLVQSVSPGSNPDVVLDQLLAAGCVEVHEDRTVRCTNRAYIPAGISVERIARIGTVLGALSATFTHNLLMAESDVAFVERQVQTDYPVSQEGRRRVREWLLVDGTAFLEKLDRWLTDEKSSLGTSSGTKFGVAMCMYEVQDEGLSGAGMKVAANQ